MSKPKRIEIRDPLVIMFRNTGDDKVTCVIHPDAADSYESYGLLVCDLVRHVANAYGVTERDVWKCVDRERHHHTTSVESEEVTLDELADILKSARSPS